jgi:membrane fusion protein (multidrug efflux system)
MALTGLGTLGLAGITVDTPRPELIAWLVLRSFGLGLTVVPILAGGMSSLPPALINDGSALRTVAQRIAAGLQVGDEVAILTAGDGSPTVGARITAIDSRVDPTTRNATVRAEIRDARTAPAPGASVRVQVPAGPEGRAAAVPVSALRKGPAGDHVFVITPDKEGKQRAHSRSVRSGEVLGDEVLILDGVQPGELVATSGSFKLRDSVLVAVAGDSTGAR